MNKTRPPPNGVHPLSQRLGSSVLFFWPYPLFLVTVSNKQQARKRMHKCILHRSLKCFHTCTQAQDGPHPSSSSLPFPSFFPCKRERGDNFFFQNSDPTNGSLGTRKLLVKFFSFYSRCEQVCSFYLILNVHCTAYPAMVSLSFYLPSFES